MLSEKPKGELVIRTIAMPADTNPNGDVFGGWLMSQMDLGSGILASKTAKTNVTVPQIISRCYGSNGGLIISATSRSGGHGDLLCLGGKNWAHLDNDSGRGLGGTLPRTRHSGASHTRRLYLRGVGRGGPSDSSTAR